MEKVFEIFSKIKAFFSGKSVDDVKGEVKSLISGKDMILYIIFLIICGFAGFYIGTIGKLIGGIIGVIAGIVGIYFYKKKHS